MEIKRYEHSNNLIWNNFIANSKNGLFLFNRDYLDYHKDRFIDHSLLIFKNDKLIAVFPANEKELEIYSHEGLTFGSLIMSFDIKSVEVIEIFNRIKEYYKKLGFERIIYKSIPSIFHKYPADEDLYALFRVDAQLFRRDISSVVKINSKIRFSESKRQSVTKCLKNEIVLKQADNFDEYWDLLADVLSKFDTKPVHSLQEINNLKRFFPENIKLYEARKNDELLAGIVIYDYEDVVHTQYMANSQTGRKFGALDFINNHLINEIYDERTYYSFGISTENQGKQLNEGLIQQKEMMGSRGITIDFYKITL